MREKEKIETIWKVACWGNCFPRRIYSVKPAMFCNLTRASYRLFVCEVESRLILEVCTEEVIVCSYIPIVRNNLTFWSSKFGWFCNMFCKWSAWICGSRGIPLELGRSQQVVWFLCKEIWGSCKLKKHRKYVCNWKVLQIAGRGTMLGFKKYWR